MNSQRLLERFLRYVQIDTTARQDTEDYPSSPGQLELGRLLVAELAGGRGGRRPAGPAWHRFGNNSRHGQRIPPGDRVLRPSGHVAGDDRQGGQAAGDPRLCRRRHCPARRPEQGDSRGRQPRIGRDAGPHDHHHRRHDAAGRRRQGRRGDHHGNGRLADGAPRDRRTARCGCASPATRRSATAWITSIRGRSARPSATRSTARGSDMHRRGDVFRRPGRGDDSRREHPSVDRQGANDQRRSRGGPFPRTIAAALSLAGKHRRPRRALCIPIEISGGVGEVKLHILLRDFDAADLVELAALLRRAAATVANEFPAATIDVKITQQYRNMADGLAASRGHWPTPSGPWSGWADRRS